MHTAGKQKLQSRSALFTHLDGGPHQTSITLISTDLVLSYTVAF